MFFDLQETPLDVKSPGGGRIRLIAPPARLFTSPSRDFRKTKRPPSKGGFERGRRRPDGRDVPNKTPRGRYCAVACIVEHKCRENKPLYRWSRFCYRVALKQTASAVPPVIVSCRR